MTTPLMPSWWPYAMLAVIVVVIAVSMWVKWRQK